VPDSQGRCLFPCSDEFECQRSRLPGTKNVLGGLVCGVRLVKHL